jgi:hypothetical protein
VILAFELGFFSLWQSCRGAQNEHFWSLFHFFILTRTKVIAQSKVSKKSQISQKQYFLKIQNFGKQLHFEWVSTYVKIRMVKKSLEKRAILGKNLEESPTYKQI